MAKCKRCGLKTALEEKDIKKMLDELKSSNIALVDDDLYERRIGICMDCDKLQYGSTCMICGAVVQMRCRMERGKCPFPGNAKWH